jgi:hypothetical protein
MNNWIWNPKIKGSGIIECIPQKGLCPNNCVDCFFQSGRSYLEPLDQNLPHIPTKELAKGRIVRINDGNDSNNQRELVEQVAQQFDDYFFNTSINYKLGEFSAPVVLTLNPAKMTDNEFHKVDSVPNNLMFVRFRVNLWNLNLLKEAIDYYTPKKVPVILTFMAYYTQSIPDDYKNDYIWKQRTLNSYWCLKSELIREIIGLFEDNPYVYPCSVKGQHSCIFCGNCLKFYYATKERMRNV